MSFEQNVAIAGKLLKIRSSFNNKQQSAVKSVDKAQEMKPEIDPKLSGLQKELAIVRSIKTGRRQDVPGKLAKLLGARSPKTVTYPTRLFKKASR